LIAAARRCGDLQHAVELQERRFARTHVAAHFKERIAVRNGVWRFRRLWAGCRRCRSAFGSALQYAHI